MGIKGGSHHQILYMNNVKLIDEGYRGIEWRPPSFLLNGAEVPEDDYVEIHDDLFTHFHDYFVWVETYNPAGPKEFNSGFNYLGLTAICGESLVRFRNLIDSLMNLFNNAPENIVLTGSYCWDSTDAAGLSGRDANSGHYQQIRIEKDNLLNVFNSLKKLTDRAIESNGYLLHCGI